MVRPSITVLLRVVAVLVVAVSIAAIGGVGLYETLTVGALQSDTVMIVAGGGDWPW